MTRLHLTRLHVTRLNYVMDTFHRLFRETHRVQLLGGGAEPEYLPPTVAQPEAIIRFREDFVSSALHEVAHWCLAGPSRRQLVDYGYWYQADRDAESQARFEHVERRPQALEWMFSIAAGVEFRVSLDNPGVAPDNQRFRCTVRREAARFLAEGLPARAHRFAAGLAGGQSPHLDSKSFAALPR